MEVALKYVPHEGAAMELRVTLPTKAQARAVRTLASVLAKTYKKRHGAALEDACAFYRGGARIEGASRIAETLSSGDELIPRTPRRAAPALAVAKPAPVTAVAIAGKENALAPASKRRRIVRIMVIADLN